MPVLRMVRRERYAQARARGLTHEAASKDAGYTGSRQSAWMLEGRHPEIKARITELMEANAEAGREGLKQAAKAQAFDDGLTRAEVLSGLRRVFEMAVEARPVFDKEGDEKGFTVNLTAANRALELMGKEAGMFVDRKHIVVDRIERMDLTQLQAAIADIDGKLAELRRLPGKMIDITPGAGAGVVA